MAEKKRYIAQYRMPVGFDNPPINLPVANEPRVIRLTDAEAKEAKQMLPDLKLVRAKDQEGDEDLSPEEQLVAATEEESEEEASAQGEEEDSSEEEPATTEEDEEEEQEETEAETAEEEETKEKDEDAGQPPEEELHYLEDDEDFPGADKLIEHSDDTYPGGLVTVEAVIAYGKENDLTEITGIGSARSEKIENHIKENYSELLDEE